MDPSAPFGPRSNSAPTSASITTHVPTHRPINMHGRLMYDEIVLNDVWINAILSTLALTCAACVCICFLYCKIQQWKNSVRRRRDEKNARKKDNESLPSYTIATGLPTYDEALERMQDPGKLDVATAALRPPTVSVVHLEDEMLPKPKPPDPKFGLVSHTRIHHESGCSHCLSVQELLETYDVR